MFLLLFSNIINAISFIDIPIIQWYDILKVKNLQIRAASRIPCIFDFYIRKIILKIMCVKIIITASNRYKANLP